MTCLVSKQKLLNTTRVDDVVDDIVQAHDRHATHVMHAMHAEFTLGLALSLSEGCRSRSIMAWSPVQCRTRLSPSQLWVTEGVAI